MKDGEDSEWVDGHTEDEEEDTDKESQEDTEDESQEDDEEEVKVKGGALVQIVNGITRYKCKRADCDKSYTTRQSKWTHEISCVRNYVYVCPHANAGCRYKGAKQKGTLKRHTTTACKYTPTSRAYLRIEAQEQEIFAKLSRKRELKRSTSSSAESGKRAKMAPGVNIRASTSNSSGTGQSRTKKGPQPSTSGSSKPTKPAVQSTDKPYQSSVPVGDIVLEEVTVSVEALPLALPLSTTNSPRRAIQVMDVHGTTSTCDIVGPASSDQPVSQHMQVTTTDERVLRGTRTPELTHDRSRTPTPGLDLDTTIDDSPVRSANSPINVKPPPMAPRASPHTPVRSSQRLRKAASTKVSVPKTKAQMCKWLDELFLNDTDNCYTFHTDNKGLGVAASKDLHENDLITVFYGDTLSTRQYPFRLQHLMHELHGDKYVMEVEHGRKLYFLDATKADHHYMGRYINHSAIAPNCKPRVVLTPSKQMHVVFVATEYIPRGCELTYTYNVHNGTTYNKENAWYLTS